MATEVDTNKRATMSEIKNFMEKCNIKQTILYYFHCFLKLIIFFNYYFIFVILNLIYLL